MEVSKYQYIFHQMGMSLVPLEQVNGWVPMSQEDVNRTESYQFIHGQGGFG